MGFHAGLPAHVLVVGLLLLSVSPGSALSTRNEAQQLRGADPKTGHIMNYQIPKDNEDKKEVQEDDSGDESDSDDEESDAEKAADKAREEQKGKLQKSVDKAKAKLLKNLEEQAEIASQLSKAVDDAEIIANVKAVKNETESAAMAVYLGDMWKEMQTFSSPFYQEHLMERRELLEMREKVFRALLKTKKAELKRQKLAWEKEDAQEDEDDESDPEKKAEDKKKVTKLKKAEKKAEKEEKADKDAFNLMGPMPWMKDKKEEPKEVEPTEAPVDNTVKPDWMKALDGSDDKKAKKAASIKDNEEDDDDEEDDKKTKKKDKKAVKDEEDDDDEKEEKKGKKEETKKADKDDEDDDDKDDEKEEKKAKKKKAKEDDEDDDDDAEEVKKPEKKKDKEASKDDEDDDGFDIMDKPPWMKNKKKQKAVVKKEGDDEEPADDNTVKPAWMKSLENSDDEEDTSESSSAGSEKKKSRAKAPVAPGKHKPMFNKRSMPSVSPAVQCVMILAWQFFIVYTVLAVLRTVNQLSQSRFPSCLRAQEMVAMLCPYVMFAPMLSVLFLACRMRAIQLTEGDTEKYGLPQWWVQRAMYAATYGVMFQAVLQLLNFMLNYRIEADGSVVPIVSENRPKRVLFAIAKYFLMACIYGGFTAVCIGTIFMPAPKEWGVAPPVSATLRCTMMLTTTFFMIYLGLSLFRTAEELRPSLTSEISVFVKVQLLFWRARQAVNLAPMLCILFIVVRMRALQIDPKNGNPPWWAQAGMYLCAGAMVFQVTASILLPLIDRNAYILPGPVQGQIILVMSIKPLKIVGHLIRYVPLLCMYGGASAVVASIFVMKAPKGEVTPDISATTSCIVALTTLYFVVFTAVYLAQTVLECLRESSRAKRVVTVLDAGQRTVMFAPMLCVLFIAARMRALQLTRTVDDKIPASAGPQTWVQEGMYFATGAIFLQVFLAYITTGILGAGFAPVGDDMSDLRDEQHAPRSTTDDPQSKSDKRSISPNWAVAAALDIFKYLCLFAMYGGAVSCMVGIVVMTPETLPPYHQSHGVIQGLMKML